MKLWTQAAHVARHTPEARNRYVDFLRAVSILVVIAGHWTAAAPYVWEDGGLGVTHMLTVAPWTRWLTWGVQVMPIFFFVGGFSHGKSWSSARAKGTAYGAWLEARLRRLVWPVLALVAVWAGIAAIAHFHVPFAMIHTGSQMALIPIWFLAVYVVVAMLVPITHAAWRRFGWGSFWALAGAAALGDVAYFSGHEALGWVNYLFVWGAIHQLGFAWEAGRMPKPGQLVLEAAVALLLLGLLIRYGRYPVSMVGVPTDAISNTTPPKVVLLFLGFAQISLLLALEAPLRRWLARSVPWTAVVLVNGMIMTVFLWHMTALAFFVGLLHLCGDVGLGLFPGTGLWWAARPIWLAFLVLALVPLVLLFSRFERLGPPRPGAAPAAWRMILGSLAVCLGLALFAFDGIAGTGLLGLRTGVLALTLTGALLIRRWGGRGGDTFPEPENR